jgi:ankyrin repeat protein
MYSPFHPYFAMLPNELIIHILSMIHCSKALYTISITCKRFRNFVRDIKPKEPIGKYSARNDIYGLILFNTSTKSIDSNGQTILHISAFNGYKNQVKFILQSCPTYINDIDKFQNSPLLLAVIRNHEEICDILISHGSIIQSKCLDYAIQNLNHRMVKKLLEMKVKTVQSLFLAIEIEDIDMIKIILPYYKESTARIRNGWTLLHCAVHSGNISICKLLLEYGCFINAVDDYGISSLHISIHTNGGLEMVKFLVENGACMNIKSLSGISPLIRAVMCKNYAVSKYLIKKGCDTEIRTVGGATAFSIATVKGYFQILKLLPNP